MVLFFVVAYLFCQFKVFFFKLRYNSITSKSGLPLIVILSTKSLFVLSSSISQEKVLTAGDLKKLERKEIALGKTW